MQRTSFILHQTSPHRPRDSRIQHCLTSPQPRDAGANVCGHVLDFEF